MAEGNKNVEMSGPSFSGATFTGSTVNAPSFYKPSGGVQAAAIETVNYWSGATGTKREQTEGTKENVMSFGNGTTAVLMLAGGGKGSDVFKKDVLLMKHLLTGEHIGIEDDYIFNIYPIPKIKTAAVEVIENEIVKIRAQLDGSNEGLFIFYYSGHFRSDHNLVLDNTKNDSKDLCSDEELAKLLKTIPAKHMLLILDMCYSGQAKMGAKDGGESLGDTGPQEVPVSHMFKFLLDSDCGAKGGAGASVSIGPVKVVQWSSSTSTQSFYDKKEGYSLFTKAICDAITTKDSNLCEDVGSGNYVSVLEVNAEIVPKIRNQSKDIIKYQRDLEKQTPVILPDYAREEDYFIDYPYFAKIK